MEQKKAEAESETCDPDTKDNLEVNLEEETQVGFNCVSLSHACMCTCVPQPLLDKEKQKKGTEEDDGDDLAELLQSVETHTKSPSSKRREENKKSTTDAKESKIRDRKRSELLRDEEDSETHMKSPSSKRKEKAKKMKKAETAETVSREEKEVEKSTHKQNLFKKSEGKNQ